MSTPECIDIEGDLEPETVAAAREEYDRLAGTAKIAVREAAKAMDFDSAEYDERVTPTVISTVRDALFANRLRVRVATRSDYDAWTDSHSGYETIEVGSADVEHVAWHAVQFSETVVAATFHSERTAAVETLRRQAFGRCYRPRLSSDS